MRRGRRLGIFYQWGYSQTTWYYPRLYQFVPHMECKPSDSENIKEFLEMVIHVSFNKHTRATNELIADDTFSNLAPPLGILNLTGLRSVTQITNI